MTKGISMKNPSNDRGRRPRRLRPAHPGALAGLALTLAVVGACAPVESGGEQGGPPSVDPVDGGTLTIGRLGDVLSLDGNHIRANNYLLLNNVYDRLIEYDEDLEPHPSLAESWEVNDDYTQVTFDLREDVTFHDGKPLTAADVVYTIERVRDPEVGATQLSGLSNLITDMETPDDYTLSLTLSQPTPGIFDMFNFMAIVDQETVEGPDAEQTANGTGPYELEDWSPGNSLTLIKNEGFWGEEPLLDRIETTVVGDAQSLATQVESGAINVAEGIVATDASRLEGQGIEVVNDPVDMFYITANTTSDALSDARVRQAINYAIDRERFASEVMEGYVEPTSIFWPTRSPAHDEQAARTYDQDLNRAEQLLAEAGAEDLEIEIVTNASFPELEDMATILQADLAEIGVELTVRSVEAAEWAELATTGTYQDLAANIYGVDGFHPAYAFTISRPLTPDRNFSNVDDPRHQELVNDAILALTETDQDATVSALTDYMLDESFMLPISSAPRFSAVAGAGGITSRVGGGLVLRSAYVTE
ncbi:ABC transporter substrate-binding protein [Ruania alba]|uniref:Peptide/nickel transport system substrate-binding protein n=1 Tax=Ruania alba TaxID=648782 RepID=A0A1H5HIK5_9MICO|nr:ABC transporter substrate-binding protein [Ruania alba]SEE27807.1 peptide/nickel transport system substrate-binding protein [Ruania alba]